MGQLLSLVPSNGIYDMMPRSHKDVAMIPSITILKIPIEVLTLIFSFMSVQNVTYVCAMVCKQWKAAALIAMDMRYSKHEAYFLRNVRHSWSVRSADQMKQIDKHFSTDPVNPMITKNTSGIMYEWIFAQCQRNPGTIVLYQLVNPNHSTKWDIINGFISMLPSTDNIGKELRTPSHLILASRLNAICRNRRVIIAIDGINNIEAPEWNWLRKLKSCNIKVIISTKRLHIAGLQIDVTPSISISMLKVFSYVYLCRDLNEKKLYDIIASDSEWNNMYDVIKSLNYNGKLVLSDELRLLTQEYLQVESNMYDVRTRLMQTLNIRDKLTYYFDSKLDDLIRATICDLTVWDDIMKSHQQRIVDYWFNSNLSVHDISKMYSDALDRFNCKNTIMERNIGGFMITCGYCTDAHKFLFRALDKDVPQSRSHAKTMNNIGIMYSRMNDYFKAFEWHTSAANIYENLIKNAPIDTQLYMDYIHTICELAMCHLHLNNSRNAILACNRALELFKLTSLPLTESYVIHSRIHSLLGDIYVSSLEYDKSEYEYIKSLAMYNKSECKYDTRYDTRYNPNIILSNIRSIYYSQGRYDDSIILHQKALVGFEKASLNAYISATMENIGLCYARKKSHIMALDYLNESYKINMKLHHMTSMSRVILWMDIYGYPVPTN
jgi:tetratricopeptide (TPR) repeat protein